MIIRYVVKYASKRKFLMVSVPLHVIDNHTHCTARIMIEQKGINFDHDFVHSFPYLFIKKRKEEKEN